MSLIQKSDSAQAKIIQIDIMGPDCAGLVYQVSDVLYSKGANLADTSFITLGAGCRLSVLAEFEDAQDISDIKKSLLNESAVKDMTVTVQPFPFASESSDHNVITHRLFISGGDRPGLVQRISEIVSNHGANIVRLNAHREPKTDHGFTYVTRLALNIPDTSLIQLENELVNIAGSLRLSADLQVIDQEGRDQEGRYGERTA